MLYLDLKWQLLSFLLVVPLCSALRFVSEYPGQLQLLAEDISGGWQQLFVQLTLHQKNGTIHLFCARAYLLWGRLYYSAV